MALTKTETLDSYEIAGPHKVIICKFITVIEEDGVELSRKRRRDSINPGDDASSFPQEIQDLVATLHTQERIDAFVAELEAIHPA